MNQAQPDRRLQAGGTLNPRRHIYVERPQDAELLRLLLDGEYSNVLTPRQMGKSSLMARTAVELAARKVRFAAIDVAGELGSPPEAESWYLGLLNKIGRDLGLGIDIQAWWNSLVAETNNQKLLHFFREEVAAHIERPVVIFLDEIDATLKLPYTDDLFTALRTMYNERSFVPAYERVTFCLLGVATPNELIKHSRTTPYNIGRTIHLRDFNEAEDDLSPLARVLSDNMEIGLEILRQILTWTGGHPYLTIKLCDELSRTEARGPGDVDTYVERAFTDLDRLHTDDHFQDILRFLTTRVSDRHATLQLYARIIHGARERDQADLGHAQLKLSGLVKRDDSGCLIVRNLLYQRLFDKRWARRAKPMPALRWAPAAAAAALMVSLGIPLYLGLRPAPVLELGRTVESDLTPGESRTYSISLKGGQFLNILVDQKGIDLAVTVSDPQGRRVLQIDSPNGTQGPERVIAIAEASGMYRIRLDTVSQQGLPGSYLVRIDDLRAATEVDRDRAIAVRTLAEGRNLRREAELSAAVKRLEVALERFQRLGDFSGQDEALQELGLVYRRMSRYAEASAVYRRALPLTRQEAATLFRLGENLVQMGETTEAIASFQRARRLWLQVGNKGAAARSALTIGNAHHLQGNHPEALSFYTLALKEANEVRDIFIGAAALFSCGELYLSLDQFEQAANALGRALDMYRMAGDIEREAATLNLLGRAYMKLGSLEMAFEAFRRSHAIVQRLGNPRIIADSLLDLGLVYEKQGNTEQARNAYEEALRLSRGMRDLRVEAKALNSLGGLYNTLGKPLQALEIYQRALQLWRVIRDSTGEVDALLGIAEAERRRGNLSGSQVLVEQVLGSRRRQLDRPRWSSYGQQRLFDFYVDLLMEQGKTAAALEAAEKSRVSSATEAIAEISRRVPFGLDSRLWQRQRKLENRITVTEVRLLQASEGERRAEAEQELRDLLAEYETLHAQILRASPQYAALSQPRLLSVHEVQTSVLDRETLLLQYKLGEQRSFLWAVTPTTFHSFVLPGRAKIEEAVKLTYNSINRRHVEEQAEAMMAITRMVLSPAAPLLKENKRLLIVADGALNYLPFGALYFPNSALLPLEPLVTMHEIINIPSVSTLAALRREWRGRPPAPQALAIVANPTLDPQTGLRQLPFAKVEAAAISSLAPSQTYLATGDFADRELVLSDSITARYRIIHFATHTILNRQPELSALVLAQINERGSPQDGLLRSYEIANLKMRADLVVLSGCSTSPTAASREGFVGLSEAFLFAGAKGVISSLWHVDDRATSELMVRFYREMLSNGRRPAEALRMAQISMLRDGRLQKTFYWAGFGFEGDWK